LIKRAGLFIYLLFIYSRDLLHSNIKLAIQILSIRPAMGPNMIKLNVKFNNERELLFLTHLVTITPGTLSVDYLEKENNLLIHILFPEEEKGFVEKMNSHYIPLIRGIFG